MTLEEYLRSLSAAELLPVEHELLTGMVPANGFAQSLRRVCNEMIDEGEMSVNAYRKIFLPTLARAIHKEFARRFYNENVDNDCIL